MSIAAAMPSMDILASASSFSYLPLHGSSKEIRLVRISSASNPDHDDAIILTLESFKLEKGLVYDALSYMWGDPLITKPVVVNGCRFQVTENLHAALLQLRKFKDSEDYSRSMLIWIDALCINQADDDEKSLQVQMMRRIFQDAKQVIVWLGTPKEDCRIGFDAIATLTKAYNDYKSAVESGDGDEPVHYRELTSSLTDYLAWYRTARPDPLKAIRYIFRMAWWDRVWIIQEVAAAQHAWVLFGSTVLGLEPFRHLFQAMTELRKIPDRDVGSGWSMHSNQIFTLGKRAHKVLKPWLSHETALLEALKMLYVTGDKQATHASDRFYAIMGLRVNAEAMIGKVDYALPWQDLYEKAARALLAEHGLVVLSFCSPFKQRLQNDLPSWVPDWTKYIPFPHGVGDSPETSKIYSASGNTSQPFPTQDSAGELTLLGTLVATIQELRDPWPLPPIEHGIYPWATVSPAMQTWHSSITTLALSLPLPQPLRDDIAMRATTSDLIDSSTRGFRRLDPADPAVYEAFRAIIAMPLASDPDFSFEDLAAGNAVCAGYCSCLVAFAEGRRPFVSREGHLGIAPEGARVGDWICVFHQADVPFVVREGADGRYTLLGAAYVDGIMDGEFMGGDRETVRFVLC